MSMFSIETAIQDFARDGAEVVRPRAKANGVHVKFENGVTVSVQWGPCTYSSNHDSMDFESPAPDATTAEVAVWKGGGEFLRWANGDSVQGWQSWDEVQAILDLAARDALPDPIAVAS